MEGGTLQRRVDQNGNSVLEAKPATLHIKLPNSAYDYMVSKAAPEFFLQKNFFNSDTPEAKAYQKKRQRQWEAIPTEDRLKLHLIRICRTHKGKYFTFDVLSD